MRVKVDNTTLTVGEHGKARPLREVATAILKTKVRIIATDDLGRPVSLCIDRQNDWPFIQSTLPIERFPTDDSPQALDRDAVIAAIGEVTRQTKQGMELDSQTQSQRESRAMRALFKALGLSKPTDVEIGRCYPW